MAIKISSRVLFPRLLGLNGTGLAQPKIKNGSPIPSVGERIRNNGIKTVPIGSIWTIGLIVNRPIRRAVSSPHLFAVHAWANSWKERSATRHIHVAIPFASWANSIEADEIYQTVGGVPIKTLPRTSSGSQWPLTQLTSFSPRNARATSAADLVRISIIASPE